MDPFQWIHLVDHPLEWNSFLTACSTQMDTMDPLDPPDPLKWIHWNPMDPLDGSIGSTWTSRHVNHHINMNHTIIRTSRDQSANSMTITMSTRSTSFLIKYTV